MWQPDVVCPGYAVTSAQSDGDPTSRNCGTVKMAGTSVSIHIYTFVNIHVCTYINHAQGAFTVKMGLSACMSTHAYIHT